MTFMLEHIKKINTCFKNLVDTYGKKKILENLAIIALVGVVFMIAAGTFFGDKNEEEVANMTVAKKADTLNEGDSNRSSIENILSEVRGAGRVKVAITYVSGNEIVPAIETKKDEDAIQEKDKTGGERSTKQNNYENKIAYEELQSGVKKPVILKELKPKPQGVVVVTDGADNPMVRQDLSRAVQVLTDVPIHKIQILKMK